jgi:hypothetical protein
MRDRDEGGADGDDRQHARAADDPPLPAERGGTIRAPRDEQQRGAPDEPDGRDQVQEARDDAEDLDGSGLSARC